MCEGESAEAFFIGLEVLPRHQEIAGSPLVREVTLKIISNARPHLIAMTYPRDQGQDCRPHYAPVLPPSPAKLAVRRNALREV